MTFSAQPSFQEPSQTFGPFLNVVPSVLPLRAARGVEVVVLSGADWLDSVEAIHKKVRAALSKDEQHFLLPKERAYFQALLLGEAGLLFGAFVGGQLAGTASLVWADSVEQALSAGKLTAHDANGKLKKKYGKGKVAVIQAMGVSKDFAGNSLSKWLLKAMVEKAVEMECKHIFAQVSARNTLSWLRFLDQDFAIVSTWRSDHNRFLLRWLCPQDKAKFLRRVKPMDRLTYNKDCNALPVLVTQLTRRLELGCTACLEPGESDVLSVVYRQPPFAILHALKAMRNRRHVLT